MVELLWEEEGDEDLTRDGKIGVEGRHGGQSLENLRWRQWQTGRRELA
jgi:hypothetical protein